MRSGLYVVMAASILSSPCLAQHWELGGAGGYGWYADPSIASPFGSIETGMAPKGVMGVVFGENLYEHVSGEIRYLFQFGGPQLKGQGAEVTSTGYTNLVTYDLLVHLTNREAKLRPYVAGGAGVKVYTGNELRALGQPLAESAILLPYTHAEPTISVGAGLKYKLCRHALLRFDYRTYMGPIPSDIFHPAGTSRINGWLFNFVPLAGISYVF